MSRTFLSALVSAYDTHRRCSRAAFQKFNLSDGYPKVLTQLYRTPGSLQKELAEACRVEPATMTVLLRGMLAKGLIRKEETHVSGGKRALQIFLTEDGERLAQACTEIMRDTTARALEGFSEEEVALLESMLKRITHNLTH